MCKEKKKKKGWEMLLAGDAAIAALSLMLRCSEQAMDFKMWWVRRERNQDVCHCAEWYLMSMSKPQ